MKKRGLLKFVEQGAWQKFHCAAQDVKASDADTDPDELQAPIDDTVRQVRAERRAGGMADQT
jgi:hypothetical protein